MRWRALALMVLVVGSLTVVGCESARYVQVQQASGVVAIPSKSNSWPFYHYDHAMELIAKKCPNGYVIDFEQEEVVGRRTNVDTHKDTKDPTTVVFADKKGGVAVTSGEVTQTTHQTVSSSDITEYRIYYHAK
jgi:hypothetical protein